MDLGTKITALGGFWNMTWYFSAPLKFKQSSEINKLRSSMLWNKKLLSSFFWSGQTEICNCEKIFPAQTSQQRSSCFCNPAFSRVSLGQHVHLFVVAIVFNARLEKGVAATSVHSVIVFRTHHRIRGWDGRFKKILSPTNRNPRCTNYPNKTFVNIS